MSSSSHTAEVAPTLQPSRQMIRQERSAKSSVHERQEFRLYGGGLLGSERRGRRPEYNDARDHQHQNECKTNRDPIRVAAGDMDNHAPEGEQARQYERTRGRYLHHLTSIPTRVMLQCNAGIEQMLCGAVVAVRLALKVAEIGVQRSQHIAKEDPQAESVCHLIEQHDSPSSWSRLPDADRRAHICSVYCPSRSVFRQRWEALNWPEAWQASSWFTEVCLAVRCTNIDVLDIGAAA